MPQFLRRVASLLGITALIAAGLTGALAMSPPSAAVGPLAQDSVVSPLSALLGLSGNLRAVALAVDRRDSSPLAVLGVALAVPGPGVYPTGLVAPDGEPIHLLSLVPLAAKLSGQWRGYRIGFWPGERSGVRAARYELPAGFLEVTPENQDVRVSSRFRLRDFLTHDQVAAWPKVLVLRLPLIDKLELIAGELEAMGQSASIQVMSGFRTPQYNTLGVGRRGGRARDSRHIYGDAADIFIDADGDGRMDDLDGDGRATVADARWLAGVVERVGRLHPTMLGGTGVYQANALHGPFVHVDVRGAAVRWGW